MLAAADPANPYGAALPWPPHDGAPGKVGNDGYNVQEDNFDIEDDE